MNRAEKRTTPMHAALRALSTPPEPRWHAVAVHHGARLLLLVGTALMVYLFFPAPRVPDTAVLEQGVVAPEDVIAEFSFPIPKAPEDLERDRAEAASGVPPVFDYVGAATDSVLSGVHSFFATLDSIRASTTEDEQAQQAAIRAFIERHRISATPTSLGLLANDQRSAMLESSIESAVRELLTDGVLPSSLSRETFSTARIRSEEGEQLVPRDSLLTPERFFQLAAARLPSNSGVAAAELQRLLLIRFFQSSLVYNQMLTEAARERARAAVDPIKAMVLEGERVVGAREQIGEEEEERLRAYQAALAERGMRADAEQGWGRAVGSVLYNGLVLGIFGLLLWLFRRPLYHQFRSMMVFALLVVSVTGAAALIARLELPVELIPVTFAALIVAVLWDGRAALVLALVLALLIGGQTPFLGATAPFTIALAGAAAAFSVQVVERRSRTWHFIALISIAYFLTSFTMGLLRSRTGEEVMVSMAWGGVNAIVASLLAIGFLPLFEAFTRITTDQTLLELSDLNRKLLKRLSWDASGTYHHTINVANMAEAACHAIGANGLLARVGAYYHDIGKVVKPQYFIENQPKGRNPHDKLKPATSASIIRNHVAEGLRLAEEAKLPDVVRNFIAEHHGTQQISFFYDKAREMDPDGQINPTDFRYPGPKPQTKETAVVMMADSVESAARVLQDPTPSRIRDLVDRIVAAKITSGQLDESPLTLGEIEIVKEQLVNVVIGMHHQRIDYPSQPTTGEKAPPVEQGRAETEQVAGTGRLYSTG